MHLAYPNVDTQVPGHPFWGCVRYLSLAQAPGSPYRLAIAQTPHRTDVLAAVEALVPEWLDRRSSVRVYEIVDAARSSAGASLDLAYCLATIRCVRAIRLEVLQDAGDVWCTGTIERHSQNEPALGAVTEADFASKLRGFLNQKQDRLFFVPAANMVEELRILCEANRVSVLSFTAFRTRLEQTCTTGSWPEPTVIAVGTGQLRQLVDILFQRDEGEDLIDSTPELNRHRDFVGREEELEEVHKWVEAKRKGFLLIEGPPGVGKSALLATLTKEPLSNVEIIWYFIRRSDRPTPEYFLRNIIDALAARFSLHRASGSREEMVSQLQSHLMSAGRALSATGKKLLLIIDGLDEALAADSEAAVALTVLAVIPRDLPDGVLVLLSGRPRKEVTDFYDQRLNYEYKRKINLKGLGREGIRALLSKVTNKYELTPEIVEGIERASAGNPLYMKRLTEEIIEGTREVGDVTTLPQELRGYHLRDFNRLRTISDDIVMLLMVLAHAREPLTVEQLAGITGCSVNATAILRDKCLDVLTIGKRGLDQVLSLYHDSFADYLKTAPGYEAEWTKVYALYLAYAVVMSPAAGKEGDAAALIAVLVKSTTAELIALRALERLMESATGMPTARYILLQCFSRRPPEKLLALLRGISADTSYATESLIIDACLDAIGRIEESREREALAREHLEAILRGATNNSAEAARQRAVRLALEIALSLTDQPSLLPIVEKTVLSACTDGRKDFRALGILGLFRLKRKGEAGYRSAMSVLSTLMKDAVRLGVPRPARFETAAITAIGLFLEDPTNRQLQEDLRSLCRSTLKRIILLKPALRFLPKIGVRIMANVPSDYNSVNLKEIREFKQVLASDPSIRAAVEEVVAHIHPAYGSDETFRSAWKSLTPHLLASRAGFLYIPLTVAFFNRALTGSARALEDIYESFQDLKDSPKCCSYDVHYRIQMIQLGRKLNGQGPLPDVWLGRIEEILNTHYAKGFRPQGLDEYIGGFGGAITALVRHTGNPCHPLIEAMVERSLSDRNAQSVEGIPREKQRDMIVAREFEIHGIEIGASDPLVRGWALYGFSCFLQRREMLDDALYHRLSMIGRKMWLYYPSEFVEALEALDKIIREEFVVSMKNTKIDNNLGELVSTKTETFFAMLYSEPLAADGAMRPRMMKCLRSLFSADPLEDTFRMMITMIFDELLIGPTGGDVAVLDR